MVEAPGLRSHSLCEVAKVDEISRAASLPQTPRLFSDGF